MTALPRFDRLVPFSHPANGVGSGEADRGNYLDTGRQIYLEMCAECHGQHGEGVEGEYESSLGGEQTLEQLTRLIEATMPEQDPAKCVGESAEQVAAFIFEQFYRESVAPRPRIELQRLTVTQYRQLVADLFGELNWRLPLAQVAAQGESGLTGKYFNARGFNQKMLAGERVDPVIAFDFETQTPTRAFASDLALEEAAHGAREKDNKEKQEENEPKDHEFSMYWNGGVIAPQTGTYEFVVHSSNGFKLFINDPSEPLIDHWVSTNQATHRAKIFLLGGRVYPLRLNFFKYKESRASIRLAWCVPGQTEKTIPEENLVPGWAPPVMVLQTPFPADDSSAGYERGVQVSAQWDRSTTAAAVEAASTAVRWLKADRSKLNEKQTREIRSRLGRLVTRALGRELSDAEQRIYLDQFLDDSSLSMADRVKRVVIRTLKSPRFLFPQLDTRPKNAELGRRLALYLSDSAADRPLWDASVQGQFVRDDVVQQAVVGQHARRLLQTAPARLKLLSFFEAWLELDGGHGLQKDPELYPGFDEHLQADLRASLRQMVVAILESPAADYRQLFLQQTLPASRRMIEYYEWQDAVLGVEGGADSSPGPADEVPVNVAGGTSGPVSGAADSDSWVRIRTEHNYQAGILTHPLLLSQFAYYRNSSPIHRGVFVARRILGRKLNPPPDAVEPLSESFDPAMTTRQRVEYQTRPVACMNCHSIINPYGFVLENFDATGRFRTREKDQPIDASIELSIGESGAEASAVNLSSARQLGKHIAADHRAQRHFVKQLFQYIVKQPVEAYDDALLDQLQADFVENQFNIRELVLRIVVEAVKRDIERIAGDP